MKRLLITGGTGFLGFPCVAIAAKRGFEVHTFARRLREPMPGTFHEVDFFDADCVSKLISRVRPSHLLHLAWIATPGIFWTSLENHAWVEASKHLITAFGNCGGERVVIAGTCAEYDWTTGGTCHEFHTPKRPATIYGKCKNELRGWAEDFGNTSGLNFAWARLFFFHGPREHPARLVPSVTQALLAGEHADCSSGTQERDFLHTSDLADALISLLESNLEGPVNVGTGKPISVRQVVEIIAETCGRPDLVRLGVRPTPPTEPLLLIADTSRLRNELGWQPRISLNEGLKKTVEWWKTRCAA